DYFPCWWDDMHLLQLCRYVFGDGFQLDAWMRDQGGHTIRMRDTRLWTEFFWCDRLKKERWAEASSIAIKLGHPELVYDKTRDLQPNPLFIPERVEAGQGDLHLPPTPEYLAAKQRAERLMAA